MYFITMMESLDAGCSSRCMGFLPTFEKADEAVRENAGDIHEALYKYAVIEYGEEGVYPQLKVIQWYKFVPTKDYRGYYVPMPFPAEYSDWCNFALG